MKRIGKLITGSLACMISLVMIITPQAALAASSHSEMNGLPEPVEVSQTDAAKGIVRIQSGTADEEGNFTAKNTFSGFVVSDAGNGGVYIVTTWHSAYLGQDTVIKVTVKNDTTTDASVEAYSKEQDFCILSAGSMKSKTALPLRIPEYDSEDAKDALKEGSAVKALGFDAKAVSGTEFSSGDVRTTEGIINSLEYEKDSAEYVSHTASIESGMDGGPLVDENGYVIGVNNSKKSVDGAGAALQIEEVDKLLDSNDIVHQTRDKDELYGKLYSYCDKSIDTYKKVKKADKKTAYAAIQNAIKVMGESTYDRSALQSSYDELTSVMESVELKTPKSLIMIFVLGAVIIALTAWLISLIVWNRKYEQSTGTMPAKQPKSRKKKSGARPQKAVGGEALSTASTTHLTGAKLTVTRTGAVYEINKNIVTMGRSPEADVTIEDNVYVARMHAMVENRKGTYFLHDMGTTNGTYLNGQKIDENGIRLVPGDIIGLGNEEIEFR